MPPQDEQPRIVVPWASKDTSQPPKHPHSDHPVIANFSCSKVTIAAGVAIFHVASARVVVCYHTSEEHWFLPKGRKDVLEDSGAGAEREGFEESGYRNRLLPIPMDTRQPHPAARPRPPFVTEPLWTQLLPIKSSVQYILHWYIAETLPPDVEGVLKAGDTGEPSVPAAMQYRSPPKYPLDLSLPDRIKLEPEGYEPVHHPNTAVNEEEALYRSFLLPIEKAMENLRGTIQADVVRSGWEAIAARWESESKGGS